MIKPVYIMVYIHRLIRMQSHAYQGTLLVTGLAQPRFSHFIGRRLNSSSFVWSVELPITNTQL